MAFDNPTRNRLQRLVGDCRELLTKEFDSKLQEIYGIYADEGRVLDLERLPHLDDHRLRVALLLRERIQYLATGGGGSEAAVTEAVRRVLREQAFTVLNRFVALRMAEERGIIVESVGAGFNSKGFKTFSEVAFSGLGDSYQRYRVFLFCLFDEMSTDLGVLFDRASPYGLLFPRQEVLLQLFDLLDAPDVKSLWKEDETVGWIYQYFNDPTERKKMREESAAPRNSRELAVRNQFFTPRYVVEFLSDNTLGRIWYEMTKGETKLREQCRYLVRRPNEIFLKQGETSPKQAKQDNPSQEEILKQPVFIAHRPLKDPRTILMLDPACGSMHFGLYAFDLFEIIYDEAWEFEKLSGVEFQIRPMGMKSLRESYALKEDFLKDVPRLIIEHNLHGIDIDPRCAQIAGLSLWLRAQKTWQRLGLKPAERPAVKRSNIVCAEAMPGGKALLGEFVEREFPIAERAIFQRLLEIIFEKMQLAGEAGSLLKIEEEIRSAITEAKKLWKDGPQLEQAKLFAELNPAKQKDLKIDLTGITDEQFWSSAESRIYDALRDYSEQAENGGGFQRRLFAGDAARGFAFIDVCRKRYDVAVMNPPFGEVSLVARDYLYASLPESSRDIFAAFVKLFAQRLTVGGRLGVLTNRMASFNEFLDSWREVVFMGGVASLELEADLGYGVLDAVVEAAAYVCSKSTGGRALFVNCLQSIVKEETLRDALLNVASGKQSITCVEREVKLFRKLPGNRFAYTFASSWIDLLNINEGHPLFSGKGGICSGDDFRFYRCFWEIDRSAKGKGNWRWLAKGGEFSRYRTNTHLAIDWNNRPFLLRTKNSERYGKPGATYTYRTTSNLSARVLNEGVCFSQGGPGIVATELASASFVLAYMNSFVATYCLEGVVGGGDFSVKGSAARNLEPRYLEHLPKVATSNADKAWFHGQVCELLQILDIADDDEAHPHYCYRCVGPLNTLREIASKQNHDIFALFAKAYGIVEAIEGRITQLLQLSQDDVHQAYSDSGWPFPSGTEVDQVPTEILKQVDAIPRDEPTLNSSRTEVEFRFLNKLSHYLHADLERLSHKFRISPRVLSEAASDLSAVTTKGLDRLAQNVVSFCTGSAFGRWDIQYATGGKAAPDLPDPFAPLPICPPGQLQNPQGSPAESEDVPVAYPIHISWDGILVDDPNHPFDIERRVRAAIEIIWKDRAEAIEHEACEILGVKSLRDYLRKPSGFFANHLKRYSKSRRQAPIYWPLATTSGSYTLWIYYHRLTDQTLFQCVNDFVKPKIVEVEGDLSRLTPASVDKPGARGEIERLTTLRVELVEFRDELLRVAQLPYKPNLNDGVVITASPLWKLFRLPKWQKDLKACWESLSKGEYDWAHLALSIWPQRVKGACKKNRSIAIAHGLEDICEIKAPEKKGNKRKIKQETELVTNEE